MGKKRKYGSAAKLISSVMEAEEEIGAVIELDEPTNENLDVEKELEEKTDEKELKWHEVKCRHCKKVFSLLECQFSDGDARCPHCKRSNG